VIAALKDIYPATIEEAEQALGALEVTWEISTGQ
jgi:hypothetical protein